MNKEKTPVGNVRSPIGIIKNNQLHVIKEMITPQVFYTKELGEISGRKIRWSDGGICPFHNDSHAGSFRINLVTGAFKCFSCGTSGGDIIDFTQKLYRLSFRDAITKLGKEWGVC